MYCYCYVFNFFVCPFISLSDCRNFCLFLCRNLFHLFSSLVEALRTNFSCSHCCIDNMPLNMMMLWGWNFLTKSVQRNWGKNGPAYIIANQEPRTMEEIWIYYTTKEKNYIYYVMLLIVLLHFISGYKSNRWKDQHI